MEIFSVYGQVKNVELVSDRYHPEFSRGFAYVEFDNADDAEKAIKHLDGGELLTALIIFIKFSIHQRCLTSLLNNLEIVRNVSIYKF